MSNKAMRKTLAALGVIASMVFVGFEVRQAWSRSDWAKYTTATISASGTATSLDLGRHHGAKGATSFDA